MKVVIIVSELVDSTIKEYQPDVKFLLFKTLEDLDKHIQATPVRAESLYFTREVMPQVNTAITFLGDLLSNTFLNVDKVIYITEKKSAEIPTVNYYIDAKSYTNWTVVEGYLTREYVQGVINGNLRDDDFGVKRKVVYRVPKDSYVRDKIKNKDSLEVPYTSDEEMLAEIPDIEPPIWALPTNSVEAKIIHIVGVDSEERTSFAYLVSQYLSYSGRTVILEKDVEYHRLSDYVTKSGVVCTKVDVDDILKEPLRAMDKIRKSSHALVCVTSIPRNDYVYSYLFNVLYSNLAEEVAYFVREDDFEEAPTNGDYILVVRSDVPSILKTCELVNTTGIDKTRIVGVNTQSLPDTKLASSLQLKKIISDVLDSDITEPTLINITSLKLGGNDYDLRSVIGGVE